MCIFLKLKYGIILSLQICYYILIILCNPLYYYMLRMHYKEY